MTGTPSNFLLINVLTVHIRSFLSTPFRINVDDKGYLDLGTPIGYVTCIFVVECDVGWGNSVVSNLMVLAKK